MIPHRFGSRAAAARGGLRHALGVPGLILGSTYIGFGSLVRDSGLALWHGLLSTATGWAAPGQIVLAELYAAGASLFVITSAVALTNARLLPMTMALMPFLRGPRVPLWAYFLAAHFIAVTGWAQALRVCPGIPEAERLPYFVGCAGSLWLITIACTGAGFFLAGSLPGFLTIGLVFLNPIYFMLVFLIDLRERARVFALLLGAVCGPLMHLVTPDWGLLATGLLAGSAALLCDRVLR